MNQAIAFAANRIRQRVKYTLKITPNMFLAPLRLLPDFVVIGAQKAGTSSLYQYLVGHPHVARAFRKEVHYFDNGCRGGRYWYQAHFPTRFAKWRNSAMITGEATPKYLFEPRAPELAHKLVPGAKLIAILRHPVSRAYSQFQMLKRKKQCSGTFEEWIDREIDLISGLQWPLAWHELKRDIAQAPTNCLLRGIYADQLRSWLDFFPREQLLVLNSERFFANPQADLDRVADFLGLPRFTYDGFPVINGGSYDPIPPETRRRLLEFFRPHNQRLYALLGETYDWER